MRLNKTFLQLSFALTLSLLLSGGALEASDCAACGGGRCSCAGKHGHGGCGKGCGTACRGGRGQKTGVCAGGACSSNTGMVPVHAATRAAAYPWHGAYAHTAYGVPVALVVPPTAQLQTNWSWGTGASRISRIDHQFGRRYPGGALGFGQRFRSTPAWPSDTNQFGVYYVRAPW